MSWIDGGEWDAVRGKTLRDLLANTYVDPARLRMLSQDAGIPGTSLPANTLDPVLQ